LKTLIILIISTLFLNGASFSKSKRVLVQNIYHDKQFTFYCNNPYEVKKIKGKKRTIIIKNDKYYSPRNTYTKSGKINIRAQKIEWEHVMPAHNFGKHLPCWKSGGRKACRKDKLFKTMESDMHNLVPAIGEINGDRSNYRYGANTPRIGQYGACKMQVDFKARRAFVREDIRGDIARIYFYMSDQYNINLSKQERQMMESWDTLDPIDNWELLKNERVKNIQGNNNKFIKNNP